MISIQLYNPAIILTDMATIVALNPNESKECKRTIRRIFGNVQKSVYFFSYYESLGSPKKNNHIAFFNS